MAGFTYYKKVMTPHGMYHIFIRDTVFARQYVEVVKGALRMQMFGFGKTSGKGRTVAINKANRYVMTTARKLAGLV